MRQLRLEHVDVDAQTLARDGTEHAAKAVRGVLSSESHAAQGIAQGITMQMRRFLTCDGWKHVFAAGGVSASGVQLRQSLAGQGHNVGVSHLHLRARDAPLIAVHLVPAHRDNDAGTLRGVGAG